MGYRRLSAQKLREKHHFFTRGVRTFFYVVIFSPLFIYFSALTTPQPSVASLDFSTKVEEFDQLELNSLLSSCAATDQVPWVKEVSWPEPIQYTTECFDRQERLEEFLYRLTYECGETTGQFVTPVDERLGPNKPGMYQLQTQVGYWPLAMLAEVVTADALNEYSRCALDAATETLPVYGKELATLTSLVRNIVLQSRHKGQLEALLLTGLWVALHPERTEESFLARENNWRVREHKALAKMQSQLFSQDDFHGAAEIHLRGRTLLSSLRATHIASSNHLFCESNRPFGPGKVRLNELREESLRTFGAQCEAAKLLTLTQAFQTEAEV